MTHISNGLPEPLGASSVRGLLQKWLAGWPAPADLWHWLEIVIRTKSVSPVVTSLWPCCLRLISCNSLVLAISYLWAWKSLCSGSLLEDTCPSRSALDRRASLCRLVVSHPWRTSILSRRDSHIASHCHCHALLSTLGVHVSVCGVGVYTGVLLPRKEVCEVCGEVSACRVTSSGMALRPLHTTRRTQHSSSALPAERVWLPPSKPGVLMQMVTPLPTSQSRPRCSARMWDPGPFSVLVVQALDRPNVEPRAVGPEEAARLPLTHAR